MARGSLGFAAYRTLAQRRSGTSFEPTGPRPRGELVWAHATSEARVSALSDLAGRLQYQRPDLTTLITLDPGIALLFPVAQPVQPLAADHPGSARAFLAHWAPDICLWTGGHLRPALIAAARESGIEGILADADEAELDKPQSGWRRDPMRGCLDFFNPILAVSETAAARLARLGAPAGRIEVGGRLRHGATPLPCKESDLNAVTGALAGRPVWCGAHLRAEEVGALLIAHRQAVRLLHRLLLVAIPHDEAAARRLDASLARSDLRFARWPEDGAPGENVQVVIARQEDLGLWLRIAPLSFLGGSLVSGTGGSDPFAAAAVGSGVLYGPNVRNHLNAYSRLAAAGAARIVRDPETLSTAILQLIAPDRAAAMALAGWEVVSEGAHLTDRLVELIHDALDRREARDADA